MFGNSAERRVLRDVDKIVSLKEDLDSLSWGRVLEIGRELQQGVKRSEQHKLGRELAVIAQSNLAMFSRIGVAPVTSWPQGADDEDAARMGIYESLPPAYDDYDAAPKRSGASQPIMMASGMEVLEGGLAEAALENSGKVVKHDPEPVVYEVPEGGFAPGTPGSYFGTNAPVFEFKASPFTNDRVRVELSPLSEVQAAAAANEARRSAFTGTGDLALEPGSVILPFVSEEDVAYASQAAAAIAPGTASYAGGAGLPSAVSASGRIGQPMATSASGPLGSGLVPGATYAPIPAFAGLTGQSGSQPAVPGVSGPMSAPAGVPVGNTTSGPVRGVAAPAASVSAPMPAASMPAPSVSAPMPAASMPAPGASGVIPMPVSVSGSMPGVRPAASASVSAPLPGVAPVVNTTSGPVRGVAAPAPSVSAPMPAASMPAPGASGVIPMPAPAPGVSGVIPITTPAPGASGVIPVVSNPAVVPPARPAVAAASVSAPLPGISSAAVAASIPGAIPPAASVSAPMPGVVPPAASVSAPMPGVRPAASGPIPGVAATSGPMPTVAAHASAPMPGARPTAMPPAAAPAVSGPLPGVRPAASGPMPGVRPAASGPIPGVAAAAAVGAPAAGASTQAAASRPARPAPSRGANRPGRISNLYESRDGGLCVFQDEQGHLVAVQSSRLA